MSDSGAKEEKKRKRTRKESAEEPERTTPRAMYIYSTGRERG